MLSKCLENQIKYELQIGYSKYELPFPQFGVRAGCTEDELKA